MSVIIQAMVMLYRKTQQEINCPKSAFGSVRKDTQLHGNAED